MKNFIKWDKEKVINTLKKLAKKLAHSPSAREAGGTLYQASLRYFGSFNRAKRAANLSIVKPKYNPLSQSCYKLSQDLTYILGVVLGDGFVYVYHYTRTGVIGLKVKDEDFALEFKRRLGKWNGYKINLCYRGGFYHVIFYSKEAATFIKNFDLKDILEAPPSTQCVFLRGLYDSEGGVAGSNLGNLSCATRFIHFSNSDENIVGIVNQLLNNLKIKHSIKSRIHSGFKSKKKQYKIIISGFSNIVTFYKYIGFSIKRKQQKLKQVLNSYNKIGE